MHEITRSYSPPLFRLRSCGRPVFGMLYGQSQAARPPTMPKDRRKRRPPKRSLALPDLEQTKSAVLNSLTSKIGQRTYNHAINESFIGTARNHDLLSITRLFFATEFTWSSGTSLQQQLTSARPSSGVWPTKQLIPACSIQSLPPASAESKVCAGSACDWATG